MSKSGHPASEAVRQFDLAHLLAFELKQMGLFDAQVNNYSIVYAHLPASPGYEDRAHIGFIAHLDTFRTFPEKTFPLR